LEGCYGTERWDLREEMNSGAGFSNTSEKPRIQFNIEEKRLKDAER
jgi:hypothetical protein